MSRIVLVVHEFIGSHPCVTKTCDIKWRLLSIQKALQEISQCICKALFLSDNVLLVTFPKLQGSTLLSSMASSTTYWHNACPHPWGLPYTKFLLIIRQWLLNLSPSVRCTQSQLQWFFLWRIFVILWKRI